MAAAGPARHRFPATSPAGARSGHQDAEPDPAAAGRRTAAITIVGSGDWRALVPVQQVISMKNPDRSRCPRPRPPGSSGSSGYHRRAHGYLAREPTSAPAMRRIPAQGACPHAPPAPSRECRARAVSCPGRRAGPVSRRPAGGGPGRTQEVEMADRWRPSPAGPLWRARRSQPPSSSRRTSAHRCGSRRKAQRGVSSSRRSPPQPDRR